MTTRVLLAVDSQDVTQELHSVLDRQPDITLVGQATDGRVALEMARELTADVVVMDIRMPHLYGMATVHKLRKQLPRVKLVAVSFQSDIRYVKEHLRAGVSAYVLKDCVYEELVEAVHIAAAGGQFVSPEIEIGIP
jgi:DNA-binding NarL/FixJ family response regulator